MSSSKPRVLIIEDSPALAEVYRSYLRGEPYQVKHVGDGKSGMAELEKDPPEALLLDLKLPDMDGMEILKHIHDRQIPTSVVIITGHASVDVAIDAMRYGAFDFIEKPFSAKRVKVTLRNAVDRQNLNTLVERIRDDFQRDHYHGFIGSSLGMQAVYRIIDSAAPSKATVFITGESGTGKEVCAEAIHRQSVRRDKPFIPLNCGAIPRDLMESEIFGHVRGAFTGASRDREGAAEMADGGTLFLDEIGEMDLDLQTKLLRFVQTGSFQRVGSTQLIKVDVRFICATNRNPEQEVAEGRFREDLFYRLHVIPIHIPPLRERVDDVLTLANHFLRKFAAEEHKAFREISPEVEAVFMDYEWPGNIRQLQNVLRNVVVLYEAEQVTVDMLPAPLNGVPKRGAAPEPAVKLGRPSIIASPQGIRPLHVVEKEAIERAIEFCDGNIPRAAALLEVSPSTIYRKRQAWQAEGA
jgi:two-component system, repressor protein LuxO